MNRLKKKLVCTYLGRYGIKVYKDSFIHFPKSLIIRCISPTDIKDPLPHTSLMRASFNALFMSSSSYLRPILIPKIHKNKRFQKILESKECRRKTQIPSNEFSKALTRLS